MLIERIAAGEEARYSAEVTASEEGAYTLYAYLYQGACRIGHQIEYLSIAL